MPRILLVNDDGVHAPGLRHLWEKAREIADVIVVAPSTEQSGKGLSISMYQPLHLSSHQWTADFTAHSVSGTPADCVRLALSSLMESPPDLILSGINLGRNAGGNVFYSGTVGGAIEGALRGIPSLALSCDTDKEPDYAQAATFVPDLVEFALESNLDEGCLFNVNFPSETRTIRGVRLARQGKGYYRETPERRQHPEGHDYYWLGGKHWDVEEHEESDVALLEQGYVTVVPLRVAELTCHATLENARERLSSRFKSANSSNASS